MKTKQSDFVEAALEYAEAGLPVIPLHGINGDKCTCGNAECSAPGKHPRTKNGLDDATTDESEIRRWWSSKQWPDASIAGVGGEYLCLDIDAKRDGNSALEKLIADNAPLPDTAVALTGEYKGVRGCHYWFVVPQGRQVASKVALRPGVDIRCARGYAVLPPSPHISGVGYEWAVPFQEVEEAPEWLLDLAPKAIKGNSTWEPNKKFRMSRDVREFWDLKHQVPVGEQREFLVRAARSVLTTGRTVDAVAERFHEAILLSDQSRDQWTYEEVLYLVEDVYRKQPTSELETDFSSVDRYTRDDWGNGQRLKESFEDGHLFHVEAWDKWYIWDTEDLGWREDSGINLAKAWEELTRALLEDSANTEDKSWPKYLTRCRSRGQTESAVHFAKHYASVQPHQLNADPFLLNVRNGVVDLRTGKLLGAKPEDYQTKTVNADYEEDASSDLWDKVLNDLIPDKELQGFVQKVFGYALTGSTEEHKFFYLYGPPGSGKTTLLETFAYLMGNYSESAEPSTFMFGRQEGGPTEDIARLSNARMVTTHEVEEGARWAEARIAHLTGGDKITARFLHQNSFEFYPKFKLFFSANHKPKVSGNSQSGLWRRLIIIPLDHVIAEENRDPVLMKKLKEDAVLSAILRWAVEGCQKWIEGYNKGKLLEVPQAVRDEVSEYQKESDHVLEFTEEMLVQTGNSGDVIPKKDLYSVYRQWCGNNGRRHFYTAKKFSSELQAKGYAEKKTEGKDLWVGLKTTLPQVK